MSRERLAAQDKEKPDVGGSWRDMTARELFSFKEKEEGRRKGLIMEWTRDVEEISLETRSYSVSITMADQLTALLNTNTEFSLILKQVVCIVTTVL